MERFLVVAKMGNSYSISSRRTCTIEVSKTPTDKDHQNDSRDGKTIDWYFREICSLL